MVARELAYVRDGGSSLLAGQQSDRECVWHCLGAKHYAYMQALSTPTSPRHSFISWCISEYLDPDGSNHDLTALALLLLPFRWNYNIP